MQSSAPRVGCADQPITKRAKLPEVMEGCSSVAAALRADAGLPAPCRAMLAAGVEVSLGIPHEERDGNQAQVVDFIGESLARIEAELAATCRAVEDQTAVQRREAEAAVQEASARVDEAAQAAAASAAALAERRAELEGAAAEAGAAAAECERAEAARSGGEANLLAAELEREVCEAGYALLTRGHGQPAGELAGRLEEQVRATQKVCAKLGLEESLVLMLPSTARKPLAERNALDNMAAKLAAEALEKHVAELRTGLDGGATAVQSRVQAAEAARGARGEAQARHKAIEKSLQEAQAQHGGLQAALAAAERMRGARAAAAAAAGRRLAEARDALAAFRSGPLASFHSASGLGGAPSRAALALRARVAAAPTPSAGTPQAADPAEQGARGEGPSECPEAAAVAAGPEAARSPEPTDAAAPGAAAAEEIQPAGAGLGAEVAEEDADVPDEPAFVDAEVPDEPALAEQSPAGEAARAPAGDCAVAGARVGNSVGSPEAAEGAVGQQDSEAAPEEGSLEAGAEMEPPAGPPASPASTGGDPEAADGAAAAAAAPVQPGPAEQSPSCDSAGAPPGEAGPSECAVAEARVGNSVGSPEAAEGAVGQQDSEAAREGGRASAEAGAEIEPPAGRRLSSQGLPSRAPPAIPQGRPPARRGPASAPWRRPALVTAWAAPRPRRAPSGNRIRRPRAREGAPAPRRGPR
ncbi:unnamed protein product [Prorocentrum cordatum]|uniref:Uncharacterized protein n=1 Tax=Prorocentrum cordatum TaxID=2364126 RepID=A0ABN9XK15_9DINO|nr:unnamed protein product [Polarella glacialis]